MCNCNSSPNNICAQCAQGNPCGCPPDYTIVPQPCKCCPSGYVYNQPSINYPNGICTSIIGESLIAPVDCPACAEAISSDCVILSQVSCLGIVAGTTLSQFITNYFCSSQSAQVLLTSIGNDPNLKNMLCQLVQGCPIPGGTTPIIENIEITFP